MERRERFDTTAASAETTENVPSEVIVLENDVKYAVDMACGHKLALRRSARKSAGDARDVARKKVLDVCCYTEGSRSTALGGASSVTAVDSSDAALTVAARNAELNDVQDKVRFVRADAFDFMQSELGAGRAAAATSSSSTLRNSPRASHPSRRRFQSTSD